MLAVHALLITSVYVYYFIYIKADLIFIKPTHIFYGSSEIKHSQSQEIPQFILQNIKTPSWIQIDFGGMEYVVKIMIRTEEIFSKHLTDTTISVRFFI